MKRKVKFINNYYYHIYNRGVEKRIIFLDNEDYERFIYYLYELNKTESVGDLACRVRKDKNEKFGHPVSENKLVEIICFVLMPNHLHLLVRQIKSNGVSLFMHKVLMAYAKYFNEKYQRVGCLFQGAFKAKLVDKNEYLNYLFYYILLNPLEITEPKWKEKKIKNSKRAKFFLDSYRWSSYRDFIGKSTYPFLINQKAILELFGAKRNFEKFIQELTFVVSSPDFQDLIFD